MMQDRAIRAVSSVCGAAVLFGALVAACAGTDTPARTDELEQQIADAYTRGGQVGAGASGGNGTGGSSSSGTGGSSMASAGSSGMSSGTGGSTAAGGSSSGGCDGFQLLQENCSGSNCHSSPSPGALTNFALDEATAAALEGETSTVCSGDSAPVFDSGNPAASLVMKKIAGSASCGVRMPIGGPYLEQADVNCIQTWIQSL